MSRVALTALVAVLAALPLVPLPADGEHTRAGSLAVAVPPASIPDPDFTAGSIEAILRSDDDARSAARAADAVIAPPPATFDAPPPPPAPPPRVLRRATFADVEPAGGVWAVVIGVNDYPGTRHDLRSAVNDANDMDLALARYGVSGDRRLVLRDRQATADTIRLATDWLVAHAGPDATAVFFFAGHVRKVSANTEAMVGADGAVVTDAELAERLQRLAARRAWIVMAACYGGGFTEVLAPGRILTAAADADSLAYENLHYGRSYLVQYMVREAMIEGRASDSVQGAFAYANRTLRERYPNRLPYQVDRAGSPFAMQSGSATSADDGGGAGSGDGSQSGDTMDDTGSGTGSGDSSDDEPKDSCTGLTLGVVSCSS